MQVLQSCQGFVEFAALAVGFVGGLGETIDGDDDATESGFAELARHVFSQGLRIGRDDGIESGLVRQADHLGELLIQQRFALPVELHRVDPR